MTGMPRRFGLHDRLADLLGREHRPTGRGHAHDQRLQVVLGQSLVQRGGDGLAARGAGGGLALDDIARDRHHADRVATGRQRMRLDIIGKFDRVERADRLARRRARQFGDALPERDAVAQDVDHAQLHDSPAAILPPAARIACSGLARNGLICALGRALATSSCHWPNSVPYSAWLASLASGDWSVRV